MTINGYTVWFDKFIDSWVAERNGKIVKSSDVYQEVIDWIKKQ